MSAVLAAAQKRGARVASGVAAIALFLLLPSLPDSTATENRSASINASLWQRQQEILAYLDAPHKQAVADQLWRIIEEHRQSSHPGAPREYAIVDDIALLMPRDADLPIQYLLYQPVPYFEYELKPRQQSHSSIDAQLTHALNHLGALTLGEADWLRVDIFRAALGYYERNLEIRESIFGQDHPDLASTLNNIGLILATQFDYERDDDVFAAATAALDRALAIRQKHLPPGHPLIANIYNSKTFVEMSRMEYAAARDYQQRALDIWLAAFGEEHLLVVHGTIAVAAMLERMRAFREAFQFLQRAARHLDAGNRRGSRLKRGRTLISLARYTGRFGNLDDAGPLYVEGLELVESVHGPIHPMLAMALEFYGDYLDDTGNPEQAALVHQRAVDIWEQVEGWAPVVLGDALNNLAGTLSSIGEMHEARRRYQQAIDLMSPRPEQNPVFAQSLARLAAITASDGDIRTGFELALQADAIDREFFRVLARSSPEQQALRHATTRSESVDLALSLAVNLGDRSTDASRRAWDAVIRDRAVILDELAARQRAISVSDDPVLRDLSADFITARTELANLVIRGPGEHSRNRYQWYVDVARWQKERAERALGENSSRCMDNDGHIYSCQAFAHSDTGFDEVAEALPENGVLIAYVRYHRNAGDAHYVAFLIGTEQQAPRIVPLGPAGEIDRLLDDLRSNLANEAFGPGRSKLSEAGYRQTGAQLRQLVWDPLASLLAGAETVYAVMDGPLSLLNLASLPVGDQEYLIDNGLVIHYLTAERDLVPDAPRKSGDGLLVVGNADFDSMSATNDEDEASDQLVAMAGIYRGRRASCETLEKMHFGRLPASSVEIERVAAWWRSHEPGQTTQRLSGAHAQEAAFKVQAPGKRILHLATHGFFVDGYCPTSLEDMMPDPEARPGDVSNENPLLLTGLALSGANRRATADPGRDDGILTAEEIAVMDLQGVEWAVLSACDTGLGRIQPGEGVLGLQRAFRIAGAQTVIMSLWQVEDDVALRWTTALYDARFSTSLDAAAAVRQASLRELLRRRARDQSTHPFFWASFVATGAI